MKPSIKQTRDLMGMTINVEIVSSSVTDADLDMVFSYFENVEKRFSFFKEDSEITLINNKKIKQDQYSKDMKTIFALAEKTKEETNGFFDIMAPDGQYNPSGLVKGWAIYNASKLLLKKGFDDFYVEAGGDIQVQGLNRTEKKWSVGIQNPFDPSQIVKIVYLKDAGIATSGTYRRGQHIYDPHDKGKLLTGILSISVIGPNVFEADRFATAAFAMGPRGIGFIENLDSFEAYMIDSKGMATQTSGFAEYL
ncbi:MAG: FAD:protein FMN transferase [Actinobacteria bacterium]|nr:FAD:protein FMN transferase [Actinomycetota bacterium]